MILITRPKKDALIFANDLKVLNLATQIESVISIRHRKPKINIEKQNIFLVTSLYAVQALLSLGHKQIYQLKQKSFIVIGNRVAIELKKIGLKKIIFVSSDSDNLITKLKKNKKKINVNYICSNNYNRELKTKLEGLNLSIELTYAYSVISKKKLSQKTSSLLQQRKIEIVTLYSKETAKVFFDLVRNAKINKHKMESITFLCLSKSISNVVQLYKYHNTFHSKRPDKKSFLSLIKKTV